MTKEFCPRDCEYLSITEEQQRKHPHQPHICLKYNARVFHSIPLYTCVHPDLFKCEQCYKENKE